MNAINPAVLPPAPDSLYYSWGCNSFAGTPCPLINGGGLTSTFVSIATNTLSLDTYDVGAMVTESGTDPNYSTQPVVDFSRFSTTCVGP
jgi:hypothetical protein